VARLIDVGLVGFGGVDAVGLGADVGGPGWKGVVAGAQFGRV